MRILYVTNERLDKKGGTPLRNKEIAEELVALGHRVHYIAPRFGMKKPEGEWKIPLVLIPLPPRSNISFALYEVILPTIVFFAVLFLRINVVLGTATVSSALQYTACKLLRRRFVLEVNGVCDVEVATRGFGPLVRFVYKVCYALNWKCADYFICVSQGIKDELTKRWRRFETKSTVISNAANEKMFRPIDTYLCRDKLNLPKDKFIIGFVGSLTPWHGVENLVRATKELVARGHHDFITVIVGSGDMYGKSSALVKELGIDNYVRLTGQVSHELVPYYNGAFDIACQVHNNPVIGNLGNSMKVWEYLASARTVIVSDMSETCQRIKPGLIGWKFKGTDIHDLADKLEYTMAHKDECTKIGKANREFVLSGYTWKEVAIKTAKILAGESLDNHVQHTFSYPLPFKNTKIQKP